MKLRQITITGARRGNDGPSFFSRNVEVETAWALTCTDLTSRNVSLCEDNNRLRSSLEASVTQLVDNAEENGRTIRNWKVLFWVAVSGLVVSAVYGWLSRGGVS
jgi:hypothetical protein